jgi:hypothetical protein
VDDASGRAIDGRCHGTGRSLLAPRTIHHACAAPGDELRIVRRRLL